MKTKVFAALLLTCVMALAAFASEQRRLCNVPAVADEGPVVADENRETTVIAMKMDEAN